MDMLSSNINLHLTFYSRFYYYFFNTGLIPILAAYSNAFLKKIIIKYGPVSGSLTSTFEILFSFFSSNY